MVLFQPCSPATIVGLIVAGIVDSINRHSRRRFAHVREEILEAIAPVVAHFDAAATIIYEVLAVWVVTAGLNRTPDHVNIRLRSFDCMTVFAFARMAMCRLIARFGLATTTANCMTIFNVGNINDGHGSAVALAEPSRCAVSHLKEFEDRQSSEAQSSDIFESRHRDLRERLPCQGRRGPSRLRRPAYLSMVL